MQRFEEGTVFFYEIDDELLAHRCAVHTDSFAEIDKVRRGVEACLIACSLQDSCQCMRARTLSVGSGHVDGAEAAVRVVEIIV